MSMQWHALFNRVASLLSRLLIYGPPGTGKTFAAIQYALRCSTERPVYHLTLTPETPAAELRGFYRIDATGAMVWQDGPLIRAMRTGRPIVIDEIGQAGGDVLALLLAACDDAESCSITLPTGETITPAPGYQVIATSNAAPDTLPDALRSRFAVAINAATPAPGLLERLPADIRPGVEQLLSKPDDERALKFTARHWLTFAALRGKTDAETAALAVFGADAADDVVAAIVIGKRPGR